MRTKPIDRAIFEAQVQTVWTLYQQAPALQAQGVHVVSTDEKTGIQALERVSPSQLMRPGRCERQEYEYIRHGTQCLIANFEVATGRILCPTVSDTRTEADFVAHIARTVASAPQASWIFITDQLNTHRSESLVRWVEQVCHLKQELGKKGEHGILRSCTTRGQFLQNPEHRIRFVYTPKHCSWLNQVEIWFSILVRRLLKRASFTGVQDLRQRLLAFIDYFNATLAKPFKWTYSGRPLSSHTD